MSANTDIGLSFGAKLERTLAKLTDALTDSGRAFTGLVNFLENPILSPTIRPRTASKQGASASITYLDLGAPPSGKVWDVRQIAVFGTGTAAGAQTDPFTSVASAIAQVWASRNIPLDGAFLSAPDRVMLTASAANLPLTNTWSRDEFTLLSLEHLIVAIKSLGTITISATAQVVEWDESQRRSWIAP